MEEKTLGEIYGHSVFVHGEEWEGPTFPRETVVVIKKEEQVMWVPKERKNE